MTSVSTAPSRSQATASLRATARSAADGGASALRQIWRRRVLASGVDRTAESVGRRCLVIAPHPDDETIGCGATIARKRAAGTQVDVVVVTDGRHSHQSAAITPFELGRVRERESMDACSLLGVPEDHVHLLGFEEGELETTSRSAVLDRLVGLIERTNPDEVMVTSEHDWHPDHQAVNRLTREAVARSGRRLSAFAYPVWFWADGPWLAHPAGLRGDRLVDLVRGPWHVRHLPPPMLVATSGFGEFKAAAFECYRSQTTSLTGEATWVTFPDGWLDPFLGDHEVFFPV